MNKVTIIIISLILATVVALSGCVTIAPAPAAPEEGQPPAPPRSHSPEYEEVFNKGIDCFNEGKEYILQAYTLAKLENFDEAAILSTKAEGKFTSASEWFDRAYELEQGDQEKPSEEKQEPTKVIEFGSFSTGLKKVEEEAFIEPPRPDSLAWQNKELSRQAAEGARSLTRTLIEAKQEQEARERAWALFEKILGMLPLLLSLL